jgi:hypothetical protein
MLTLRGVGVQGTVLIRRFSIHGAPALNTAMKKMLRSKITAIQHFHFPTTPANFLFNPFHLPFTKYAMETRMDFTCHVPDRIQSTFAGLAQNIILATLTIKNHEIHDVHSIPVEHCVQSHRGYFTDLVILTRSPSRLDICAGTSGVNRIVSNVEECAINVRKGKPQKLNPA